MNKTQKEALKTMLEYADNMLDEIYWEIQTDEEKEEYDKLAKASRVLTKYIQEAK